MKKYLFLALALVGLALFSGCVCPDGGYYVAPGPTVYYDSYPYYDGYYSPYYGYRHYSGPRYYGYRSYRYGGSRGHYVPHYGGTHGVYQRHGGGHSGSSHGSPQQGGHAGGHRGR